MGTLGFSELMHMAEANSLAKQREIERKLQSSNKIKKADPRAAQLKVGVQKFLAKLEEEKRIKKREEDKKKNMLLELRGQDRKAGARVRKMLNMTKSANKSCIADADQSHSDQCHDQASQVQPDEDDYGYTSTYAAEMQKKMMEKYKASPKDAPGFSNRPKSSVEIPKSKHIDPPRNASQSSKGGPTIQTYHSEPKREIPEKPKKKPLPPPQSFVDLLKLAEQKHKEPVVIKKPARDPSDEHEFEFGRPMTAKEKAEFLSMQALKKKGYTVPTAPPVPKVIPKTMTSGFSMKKGDSKTPTESQSRNPQSKFAQPAKYSESAPAAKPEPKVQEKKTSSGSYSKMYSPPRPAFQTQTSSKPHGSSSSSSKVNGPPPKVMKRTPVDVREERGLKQSQVHQRPSFSHNQQHNQKRSPSYSESPKSQFKGPDPSFERRPPKTQSRPSETSSSRYSNSSMDLENEFRHPPRNLSKPHKGRQIIHDSEEEYDSEMDDFIDDSDVPREDIRDTIGKLFNYNRRKYLDEDSDDECMESSVTQQWNEEANSARIAKKEDEEELIKIKEEEKREKEAAKQRAILLKRKQKMGR